MRHLLFACVSGAALALAGTVLGSDPEGAANLAGNAELPAGNGLAAQFPGDAVLKTHADVIFADDFEAGAIGAGWDETRNKGGKVLQFAPPGDAAGLGQRCLRVEAHLGKDTGGGLTKWFEPADPIFIHFKHNTPGQPDGEQAFWIDGALQGHWKGINWRKTALLKANALTLESYITDRWTKNPVNVVFFDNVVLARRYIGPVGRK
jgi:hypothetical protein